MRESERLYDAVLEAEGLWGEQRDRGSAKASLLGGQEDGKKRSSSHLAHGTVLTGQTCVVP